jgi:hypothetical protein
LLAVVEVDQAFTDKAEQAPAALFMIDIIQ